MSEKVRLALIGAGSMANGVHYPSLKEMEDVEMAGLCDVVEDKLNATADRFEIENRYTDYKQMIEEVDPDGVYVLMPPHHLFDLTIAAIKRKLNVFIEKPPAVTTFQVQAFAREAEKAGAACGQEQLPHHERLQPALHPSAPAVPAEGPRPRRHDPVRLNLLQVARRWSLLQWRH